MAAPSPFSKHNPRLQTTWDSTSLKALMFCPRYYQYTMLEGWRAVGAIDLEFGIYFASAVEEFKRKRLAGFSKSEAQIAALVKVINNSWIDDVDVLQNHGHPWGGRYENQWHCDGCIKYKNAKGNAAKCPWAHKGVWFPGDGPPVCGECGSTTTTARQWIPINPVKSRPTLVRLVAWYCEEQPEEEDHQGLHPYSFPDGTPAVELSFKIPLPWQTPDGEPYVIAGHIDSIMQTSDGRELFPSDNKTTKAYLGPHFWKKYNPNIQMEVYDLAGSLLYPHLPIKGVAIEAAQVMADGARFAIMPLHRDEAQREETFKELEWWIKQAEGFAATGYYPRNTSNCAICPFAGVCSKTPSSRQRILEADFTVKHWNPLEER